MTQADIKNMSFEEALAQLEVIVSRMDQESMPLEESISSYETGRMLSEHCSSLLKAAQGRIVMLSAKDGAWEETPISEECIDVE